ncbi:hypothetical protein [Culicoidibacter larvae]|uniref:DUF2207 domain-containing protein n=1 Tax=Culicoidibacter larvae TaxID=2579976 RepID=A0A5R8QFF8_9FIRM|nr:hypothetical protein [Culicoidibacter larvae]TLG76745.1 hypothetical protein FEZ08_03775 [Culicoidibacter larvae]
MRKTIITIIFSFSILCLLNVKTFAVTPEFYESQDEAIANTIQKLESSSYRPGTYPIKIYYNQNGLALEETIYITVEGPFTFITGNNAIDATGVTISITDAKRYQIYDWIKATDAHAWRIDTLEELPIDGVDTSKLRFEVGTYEISFNALGISTSVPITLIESSALVNNTESGWYDQNLFLNSENEFELFDSFGFTILKIGVVIMLVIPIIFLFLQFFWSLRTMANLKKVMHKRTHHKSHNSNQ